MMNHWPTLELYKPYQVNAEAYIKWRDVEAYEDCTDVIRPLVDSFGNFTVTYVKSGYTYPVVKWEGDPAMYYCPIRLLQPAKLDKTAISNLLVRM